MLAPWIFILLCPFSQAANTDGISEENKAKYPSPRIVILGMTGVGKSALGCSLLGMKQAECKSEGRKGCFDVSSGEKSHTQETCTEKGNFLGDPNKPFLVIDTPGFGANDDDDANQYTQNIVNTLRDDVEWAHIFLIALKGSDERFNAGLTSMITRFETIFGAKFWSNVMFVVTRGWKHKETDRDDRGENDEAWFTEKWNKIIKDEDRLNMDPSLTIPMVFINSHYDIANQRDSNKTVDPRAKEKFDQYTQDLWNEASSIKPFHLIDIKMAKTEINKLKKEKQELASNNIKLLGTNRRLQRDITHIREETELLKCSGPLGWITCSKNWARVLGFCCSAAIGFLLGTIVICSCNNPCNCCCSSFRSCGKCCRWRCCQTDGGKAEDVKRLVECGLFNQEDYEKLIVKFD